MNQLVFLTAFLGLTLGTQPVGLDVKGDIAAVELRLDGQTVATMHHAPWQAKIDFGSALLPHRLVARELLFAAAPARLGAKPVDGDAAGDAAEPRARRAPARVEAPPAAERLLERLGGKILRGRAVAGQVDEIPVDAVQLLRDDVVERGPFAGVREPERLGGRVHAPQYGTATESVTRLLQHGPAVGVPFGPTSCAWPSADWRQYDVASARRTETP